MQLMFFQKTKKFILLGGDLLILYFSLYLTLLLRYGPPIKVSLWEKHFFPFTVIYFFWLTVFYIIGLYDPNIQKNALPFYSLLGKALFLNSIVAVAFFYFVPDPGISPKRVLFINLIVFAVLFYFWRKLYNKILSSQAVTNNILIIGANDQVLEIVKTINQNPQLGYQIKVIINNENKDFSRWNKKIKIINDWNFNLPQIIKQEKIQTIVTVRQLPPHEKITRQLYQCLNLKVSFLNLPQFYEQLTGKIPINLINEIWFLENLKESEKNFYEFFKRISDIILAIVALIISLPFLPILAILIKLDSPGPVFFTQIRTGRGGKNFLAIKLRTMVKDAEKHGAEWAKENDPRITRLGKFLRKTRIDEIPQLFNIIRGEMSFVGPRPERPEFIKTLEQHIPFYKERLIVRPGLTGWAQVNFPYGASIEDALWKMQYDLYYIKNRSFILDLSIILKTIKIVLLGGGR